MKDTPSLAPAPRENPDLVGHEAAERTIIEACRSGRLPHAWLIGGPYGIGKATLAFHFARYALAGNIGADPTFGTAPDPSLGLFGTTAVPSPAAEAGTLALPAEHPVFRQVRSGGHPGLLTIERPYDEKKGRLKTEIPVEDVRKVGHFLHHTTTEGGFRVVVVDGMERMNPSGTNALLKVLEEPPPRTLLLLVTAAPGSLLPTIRSRCRKLTLLALPDAVVRGLLEKFRPDLDDRDRAALAGLAEGSIGRALDLAANGGLGLYRTLLGLLAARPFDWVAIHAFADQAAGRDSETVFPTATGLLVWWLARLARAAAADAPPAPVVAEETALIARLLPDGGRTADLERWLAVWDKVGRLFERADYANLDRKQAVLSAFACIETALG